MAYDKVIDSSALDAGMTATANAIRAKTGGSSPIAWDSANGFKAAVEGIDTDGGVELPELGDTAAQASDIAAGKVLYDDEGKPVTGTLGEATEGILINSKSDAGLGGSAGATEFNVSGIYLASSIGDNTKGVIMRPGSKMAVRNVPTSLFGDATADQVAKGATFTSAAGLLVEGTHECEGGVSLPTLTNPGAASDLASGKELIDQNGNVVSGSLVEIASGAAISASDNATVAGSVSTGIRIKAQSNKGSDYILRDGAYLIASAPADKFGDAEASDVAKGKTFTSAAGLLMEGTMEASAGSETPGITVIHGEYIPGTTVPEISTAQLEINHNIGEVKPFAFHMEMADPSEASGDGSIIAVNISMLSHNTKTISYSDKTVDITPMAIVQIKQANNQTRASTASSVTVYDSKEAADASGNPTNYNLKVYPDGFKTALYQWLQSSSVYHYTLVYGM